MTSQPQKDWRSMPIAGIIPEPGTSVQYRTGDWRLRRPVVDTEKCTNCLICWISCPDSSINRETKNISIDYEHCKGCGICAIECPVKAITMVNET